MDVLRQFPLHRSLRSDGDLGALAEAFLSASLSGESDLVPRYETALARTFGSAHAVAVNSGTAALHLGLLAVGAGEGTDVLVPAIAPLPSLLPILAAGARPVVVDISADHLGFDPDGLARSITPRTRAALAVLLWGYPQDPGPALAVLEAHGVPMIEDACQAHGSRMASGLAGRVGRIGCFSTHDFKLLSTGEGGFALTDDGDLAAFMRRFGRLGGLDGRGPGLNYKLSGPAAALGLHRLPLLEPRVQKRRAMAKRLVSLLTTDLVSELPAVRYGAPNYYSLVLCAKLGAEGMARMLRRLASRGLLTDQARFGYDLVYRRPMFAGLHRACPNAEQLLGQTFQLPCHEGLSDADLVDMARAVSDAAEDAA